MVRQPGLALSLGIVVAMAVVVLAITTWAAPPNPESDSAALISPREIIYRPQHWNSY
jgi:multisubunit Na+/H+ antiporter MnhB subunit